MQLPTNSTPKFEPIKTKFKRSRHIAGVATISLAALVAGCMGEGDDSILSSSGNTNVADAGNGSGSNTGGGQGGNSDNTGSPGNSGGVGGTDGGTPGGSNGGGTTQPAEVFEYDAKIIRTRYGVPHIYAKDYGSLGYGQGYAFAQDNLCVFLEDLLTIRGERSKFFGATGSYRIEPNGSNANNVDSDFFWKSLFAYEETGADGKKRNAWQKTRDKTIPDFQNVVTGYVAGVNRYIEELKAGQHMYTKADGSKVPAHQACAQAAWLNNISTDDMYRRFVRLSVLASSSVFVTEIGSAQPPGSPIPAMAMNSATSSRASKASVKQSKTPALKPTELAALLKNDPTNPLNAMQERDKFGSNMYAIGKDGVQEGQQSMVFGNPHFPWRGTERLYLSHNTLERDGQKEMDIMGIGLYGVPAVLIGFNRYLAWSHTVSTAYRFTFYRLELDPSDPTKYKYDGQTRNLIKLPTEIEVKGADGKITKMSRTMYRSHYGPMMILRVSGVPVLDWNRAIAFSIRDANLENDRLINQFANWNRAKSLEEFEQLHGSELGVPWVNTVASGPNKHAYYGDVTVVPHVTDEKVAACKVEPFQTVVGQSAPGLPLLNGSSSACEWGNDTDAPAKGIFGRKNLPTLKREDYVHNCNDSFWATNPAQPITGFARIIGDVETPRSLRTRLCILQAERRLAAADGLSDQAGFTHDLLKEITLNSEIYSATLAKKTVVDTVCQLPAVPSQAGPQETAAACAALAAWDGKSNLNSKGAHLWREFWSRLNGPIGPLPASIPQTYPPAAIPFDNPLPVSTPNNLWTKSFNPRNPAGSPSGLNPANPNVAFALGEAIDAVKKSGFAFDATVADVQKSGVHLNTSIPIFGGTGGEGAFTIVSVSPSRLTTDGKKTPYKVVFGNSYIQAVTWKAASNSANGFTPVADAMLTYSQSTDPNNPHYDDYTKAYSAKEWNRLPYEEADVKAEAEALKSPTIRLTKKKS